MTVLVSTHCSLVQPMGMDLLRALDAVVIADQMNLHVCHVSDDLTITTISTWSPGFRTRSVSVDGESNIVVTGERNLHVYDNVYGQAPIRKVDLHNADWVAGVHVRDKLVLLDRCQLSRRSCVHWMDMKGWTLAIGNGSHFHSFPCA